ncbi:hypothetical protein [Rhizobium rhizophilum]|uniref:DUF202 domain-containing protein n=1 Tax=Rhizobium rhizophilum TaxID=1850373 RepID=A0ABY2QNM8_9HYPH|nr:hypothetical protein [Rhizobium rhizophilum]THV10942.1 hypothetical protein E9677_21535 [Rhizobium rhizophilum]
MSVDMQDSESRIPMPDFTAAERSYIIAVAADDSHDNGVYRTLSGAAYFLPSVAIGCYGLWEGSFKMLGIGFLTMIVSLAWGFYTEWRGSHHERTGRAIAAKLRQAMENRSVAD